MRSIARLCLLLPALSIAGGCFAGSSADQPEFRAKPAAEYQHRQTSEKVTIAAEQMETDDQTREPFGKVNPYRYGVLPVLVVIQNDGPDTIRVDRMKVIYQLPDRTKVESTPAPDLRFLRGPVQPKTVPTPLGGIKVGKTKQSPLAEWEIEGRAFAAKMIPPGQSASGFFYFQTPLSAAAKIYISGLTHAGNNQELFYFEIPVK